MKTVLRRCLALLLLCGIFFLLWPSPIDPLAWRPPAAPALAGVTAPNTALAAAERLLENQVEGPESPILDRQGRVYAGLADGRIVRMEPAGGRLENVADTGGRPLALEFSGAGDLIVCDAVRGLLSVDTAGQVIELSKGAGGVPFRFTDDLDIARDGRIYFSDASSRWGHETYLYDLLEARPYGRLLRYDPASRETELLLGGLYFANGVALSPDEDYVLVNETYRYRITRLWLKGPKAGSSEIFADNLPGIPDGIAASGRGTYWVAMYTVRNAAADALQPSPFLKRQLAKLPKFFWPKPAPHGMALELDASGAILRTFQDAGGERVPHVTAVYERDGWLYLGNLHEHYLSRFRL